MKEALYYEKQENNWVRCFLCPHHCIIADGKSGLCGVRLNDGGTLYSLNYGRVSSNNLDPIEKKPLYHFYPGSRILSLGTLGCNLTCSFCQNSSISQLPAGQGKRYLEGYTNKLTPEEIANIAQKTAPSGSVGVAYTYNEPSIWYEYVLECSKKIREIGQKNVLVTNGFLEKEPLEELLPHIDAVNVDVKSIDDRFYKSLCGGRLEPVLEYCKRAKEKVLVEITNLVVTGENDTIEGIEALVDWVANNLGRDTPIHFSRYYPRYKFKSNTDSPNTPIEILGKAYEIAIAKLDYVYVGNVWEGDWDNTRCPSCHKVVIDRSGYRLHGVFLETGSKCKFCGAKVNVVGEF